MVSKNLFFFTSLLFIGAQAACQVGDRICGNHCYSPNEYTCTTDNKGKIMMCHVSTPSACAGSCYNPTYYTCSLSGLKSIDSPVASAPNTPPSSSLPASTSSTMSPTSSSAVPQTSANIPTSSTAAPTSAPATTGTPVVNNPTPVPINYPTQTADLRIINSCKTTLWFEARYGGAGAPIPGQSVTAVQALPGAFVDYVIPATGLSGSRFWAKYGCDSFGRNCLIGDQMQYYPNPPGGCPSGGCTPPVDSLFEATWGCKPGADCNSANPTTWFDTSQVDGWTIPYKLTANGATNQCDCSGTECGFSGVDASHLSLARCPTNEDLSVGGQYPSVTTNGVTASLSSVDLRIIDRATNQVVGCMSPCKKLNWGSPFGLQQSESSGPTMWMCCPTPTPDNCSPSQGCISPTTCRQGPIEQTQYVAAVHSMASGVYSYSYDDGVGLHACPAGTVTYTMEFCPSGTTYPLQL